MPANALLALSGFFQIIDMSFAYSNKFARSQQMTPTNARVTRNSWPVDRNSAPGRPRPGAFSKHDSKESGQRRGSRVMGHEPSIYPQLPIGNEQTAVVLEKLVRDT